MDVGGDGTAGATMESPPSTPITQVRWSAVLARAFIVNAFGFLWVTLFWFRPAKDWPGWGQIIRAVDNGLADLTGLPSVLVWTTKSYLFVLVPCLVLVLLGHKPTALGLGGMARYGWRIVLVSFVIALPVLVWLGLRPGMHRYYQSVFTDKGHVQLLAYALVIAVEHAWIEGVVLALALPGGGFSQFEDPPRTGSLAFLGFGQPPGGKTVFTWLGVPPEVFPALVGQALVFGAVHATKEWGEFISSFPGGLGLGMLTYRIRSVWPSVLLHIGTGGVVVLTMWLAR